MLYLLFFQYAKDVEEYEIGHGGIVLDPSKQESFGLYFSTLQPHTISPAYLDMYHKKSLLIVRMLELRLGPTLLLQVRVQPMVNQTENEVKVLYSQFSLSGSPRDSLKSFEISVPRYIRFAELRKK